MTLIIKKMEHLYHMISSGYMSQVENLITENYMIPIDIECLRRAAQLNSDIDHNRSYNMVKMLIEKGAQMNYKNKIIHDLSPIEEAIKRDDIHVVKILLENMTNIRKTRNLKIVLVYIAKHEFELMDYIKKHPIVDEYVKLYNKIYDNDEYFC